MNQGRETTRDDLAVQVPPASQPVRHSWLIYTLLTILLWGAWGLLSKPISDRLSAWQVQAISGLGLLPVIALLMLSPKLRAGLNPLRGFWLAFASGLVASLGNVAYYGSLGAGGKAAAVTPLTALYPLVTIALAIAFLGERLSAVQSVGGILSLAALYLFNVGSDSNWLTPWLGLALIPISLWGASAFLQKYSATYASAELATAGFLSGALPLSFFIPVSMPLAWRFSPRIWWLGIAVGLLFGLGNLTLILAYEKGGKASVVTPLAALYSAVTIPLAVVTLGERISAREALGIALAIAAALAFSYEKQGGSAANPIS